MLEAMVFLARIVANQVALNSRGHLVTSWLQRKGRILETP